jgi:spoIIIJ-associated protein
MNPDIIAIIKDILTIAGIEYVDVVQSELAGQTIYSIKTEQQHHILGSHPDTAHSLDVLIKKIVEKKILQNTDTDKPITQLFFVDINDQRTKQIKDLQAKAIVMAERARSFQYDVELSPMNAYERLIVHTTLAESPNIKTESRGEGRGRRVVIKYTP